MGIQDLHMAIKTQDTVLDELLYLKYLAQRRRKQQREWRKLFDISNIKGRSIGILNEEQVYEMINECK
jgi:hypothetical protein